MPATGPVTRQNSSNTSLIATPSMAREGFLTSGAVPVNSQFPSPPGERRRVVAISEMALVCVCGGLRVFVSTQRLGRSHGTWLSVRRVEHRPNSRRVSTPLSPRWIIQQTRAQSPLVYQPTKGSCRQVIARGAALGLPTAVTCVLLDPALGQITWHLAERPKSRAPTEQQTGEHASVAPLDHPAKSRAPNRYSRRAGEDCDS